uniref:Thyroglobulin type-1 domain-containing protein n=1 Tax=Cyprinodon variegatus TaxID=28743 RepID=A0A3Q2CM06_CYPVA
MACLRELVSYVLLRLLGHRLGMPGKTGGFPSSIYFLMGYPLHLSQPHDLDRPKSLCEHHRDSVQTTDSDGRPLLGAFVPQCDENGQYLQQQCHGSTGHCWCVDSRGQERAGTRTPPGTPSVDCSRHVFGSKM